MKQPFEWVDLEDQEQFDWIEDYLLRKSLKGSLPVFLESYIEDFGVEKTIYKLKEVRNSPLFREASNQMKNAWSVRQHRKKYGSPRSIKMSKEVQKKLKDLAEVNGLSQVELLDQIIINAGGVKKKDTKKYIKEIEGDSPRAGRRLQENQNIRYIYGGAIESLLKFLSEEINHRCKCEVQLAREYRKVTDTDALKTYCDAVERRVLEVETKLEKLKLMRAQVGPSLNERMQEYIRLYREEVSGCS